MEYTINQLINIPFTSTSLVLGLTTFPDLHVVVNGVSTVIAGSAVTEIGSGLYSFNFTPTASGNYVLFVQGSIQARFIVVARDKFSFLRNIEDESIGSWTWNKTTGLLTIIRQDSSTLGTFQVVDTLDSGSRERIS